MLTNGKNDLGVGQLGRMVLDSYQRLVIPRYFK